MNEYVDTVMNKFGPGMLESEGVAIPDDEEEMNWRIFFAHSQDMQGFRADIFTGGDNEEDHPTNPSYKGLRDRWRSDSRSLIRGLAALWKDQNSRAALKNLSNRKRPAADKALGIAPCVAVLRGSRGNEATRTFADALDDLSGFAIGRKTCSMIRSYTQNSAKLEEYGYSFRQYLMTKALLSDQPVHDMVESERIWLKAIEHEFYNVGPALANYMICDWLLGLWRAERIQWFEAYKGDSVFLRTLGEKGKLPPEAVKDFVTYCRNLPLRREWLPDSFADRVGWATPPRLVNEAIWLNESEQSKRRI